jgi:hypothetical protein
MVHLVEQELITNPEHISSHPVISGILVAQSLVFCVVFADHCLFFDVVIIVLIILLTALYSMDIYLYIV